MILSVCDIEINNLTNIAAYQCYIKQGGGRMLTD